FQPSGSAGEVGKLDPESSRNVAEAVDGGDGSAIRRPAWSPQRAARYECDLARRGSVAVGDANDAARSIARHPANKRELTSIGRPVGTSNVVEELSRIAPKQWHPEERGGVGFHAKEEERGAVR